jgi:mRNA interferase MazF
MGKGKNFSRPVIVIRKLTSDLFIGIPITSTIKDNDYFHSFEYNNRVNGIVKNSAMILQVRTYSIKRLMNKAGVINKDDFIKIMEKSKKLFD